MTQYCLINLKLMCGHEFGTHEATSLQQVNNRLVLTCCEEAKVLCGAVLGGLGEEPEGPDK